jgi:hypothetical protein
MPQSYQLYPAYRKYYFEKRWVAIELKEWKEPLY